MLPWWGEMCAVPLSNGHMVVVAFQEKDPLTDRQDITTHSSAENALPFTDVIDYWKGYSCATEV